MPRSKINLSTVSDEELLALKLCELPISIEDSWLEDSVRELYSEIDVKGIRIKPICYLADEWLTPDKEPVIGIPFFLAHPTLMRLEKKMILEVEGGTRPWCMKLLRHETGHAVNYAYKFYRRKKWRDIFGPFSKEYNDTYRFRPYSKNYVRHLEDYYAQYHPDEDFAETFAIWLTPGLDWRKQYKGWKALAKLEYVDELMREAKSKDPIIAKGKRYWQVSAIKITLKNFYKKKRYSYSEDFPDFHDSNLREIFDSSAPDLIKRKIVLAAVVIKKYKKDILANVARWTGERKYIINGLLDAIIKRCKSLRLSSDKTESLIILEVSTYVTVLAMNYLYTGGFSKDK